MRVKLIAANLATVLLLGVVSYLLVSGFYADLFAEQVSVELARDREVLERSALLASRQYVDRVAQRATIPEVIEAYSQADAMSRRAKASGEVDAFAAALGRPEQGGRQPEFVALTDVRGNVICRNLNPNVDVGRPLGQQFPSLSFALNGTPGRDVWLYDEQMLDVSFAPIRVQGQVVGAIVVGFEVSNGVAEQNARSLGSDVAFFIGGRVYSSSLGNANLQRQLSETLFKGSGREPVAKALQLRRVSDSFDIKLGESDYQAFAAPLPGQTTSRDSGYVVLANATAALEPVGGANRILWITVLAAVLAAILGIVLGNHFLKPVEQIEESVLRVINGDTQHRIEIKSTELGGLAYRINQLIGEMLGETEEDDEGTGTPSGDLDDPKG